MSEQNTTNWDDVEAKSLGRGHAPAGEYEADIVTAELGVSSRGDAMISLEGSIVAGSYAGVLFFDNLIIGGDTSNDKTKKAMGFAKKKLLDLGVNLKGNPSHEAIAKALEGRRTGVILAVEPIMEKNPATQKYDKPKMRVGDDGKETPALKNVPVAYKPLDANAAVTTAQATQAQAGTPRPVSAAGFSPQDAGATGAKPPFVVS